MIWGFPIIFGNTHVEFTFWVKDHICKCHPFFWEGIKLDAKMLLVILKDFRKKESMKLGLDKGPW